ncbi:MAG: TraR/DksA C4-type zinc finger protein [Methylotenera sp.]
MSKINSQQISALQAKMEAELARLVHVTQDEMNPELRASFADVSGEVADNDDEAVAGTMIDLDNAMIGLHLQKADDLNAALDRIQAGDYGVCSDCGEAVSVERLTAYPTAKRCVRCQTQYEKNKGPYNKVGKVS